MQGIHSFSAHIFENWKKMSSFYGIREDKRGVWRVCKRPLVDICSPSPLKSVPNFCKNLQISDFKIVFIREFRTRQMTQDVHQTPQSTLYPPRKRTQISKIFQNFLIQTGQSKNLGWKIGADLWFEPEVGTAAVLPLVAGGSTACAVTITVTVLEFRKSGFAVRIFGTRGKR